MKIPMKYILAIAAATFLSCNAHKVTPPKDNKPVPDSVVKTVETAPAAIEEEEDIIKLNGKIIPNERMQTKVFALVSGKIKSVSVELGDFVKKGQTLAVLQSVEVAGFAHDLSLAESNVAIAKKSLDYTKDMFQGNLATEREYINAQAEYNKALSELNRAKQVAAITGGKQSVYTLTAPLSGYVIEKTITANSEVRQDNNTNLFTIADLSNVWIIANVYEVDINNIHLGDEVKVNTLSNPEKDFAGTIDKIYSVLDPSTRTMKVRISMSNPANELKPEMFATVKVKGKSSGKMLAIPSEAVVLDKSRHYVIVKNGNNLEIREIQIVKRLDNKTFITGLSEGERVVTNSQVFLYEALNSK